MIYIRPEMACHDRYVPISLVENLSFFLVEYYVRPVQSQSQPFEALFSPLGEMHRAVVNVCNSVLVYLCIAGE